MTHVPEGTFDAAVHDHLHAVFPGAAEIDYQVRLPSSNRRVDFVVVHTRPGDADNLVHAVEVENDFEAMVKGTGQAQMYAGHYNLATPVVAYPVGHVEEPEYSALCQQAKDVLFLPVNDREYDYE